MAQENEILTPVGRLVGGHPMRANPKTDNNGAPKMGHDGKQIMETYVGIAIPKGSETHWNQTDWGRKMHAIAVRDWPNGEHGRGDFAWKVIDGDSTIPNRNGIAPNTREGYPGHWVINASTSLPVRCHHAGRYAPHEQIQNEKEIKPGDYCRVLLDVKGNGPSQSPGIYVNPVLFELTRAGVEIVLSGGPSAADVFGTSAAVLPANAQVDPGVATPAPAPAPTPAPAPAPAPVAPAPDFLNPPAAPAPVERFNVDGQVYTREQLRGFGWNDAQIDAAPRA